MKKLFLLIFVISLHTATGQKKTLLEKIIDISNQVNESKTQTQNNNLNNLNKNAVNFTFSNAFPQNRTIAHHLTSSGFLRSLEWFIDKNIKLDKPINIEFVDDNTTQGNAYFNSRCNCIRISFDIIKIRADNSFNTFTNVPYFDAVNGTTATILFHELAHYMIYNYKLPITGKEENSADQFAVMAMLYCTNNDPKFYHYAQLGIMSSFTNSIYTNNRSMVDEHAPTMERYYDMLAILCGADLKRANTCNMIGENNFQLSPNRANRSRSEYETAERAWKNLMYPYLY